MNRADFLIGGLYTSVLPFPVDFLATKGNPIPTKKQYRKPYYYSNSLIGIGVGGAPLPSVTQNIVIPGQSFDLQIIEILVVAVQQTAAGLQTPCRCQHNIVPNAALNQFTDGFNSNVAGALQPGLISFLYFQPSSQAQEVNLFLNQGVGFTVTLQAYANFLAGETAFCFLSWKWQQF